MNVFMGYNPLATKQAKVTVWVCEQDGETPVAPSNPSEGDCFVVYATDEAVLSNTPTSAKTYSNGEWVDAESGGGGVVIPEVTAVVDQEGNGTYTSTVSYDEMLQLIENSHYQAAGAEENVYPAYFILSDGESVLNSDVTSMMIGDGVIEVGNSALHADGTVTGRWN